MRPLRRTARQAIVIATAGTWIFGVAGFAVAELWASARHESMLSHVGDPVPPPVVGQHLFADHAAASQGFESRGTAHTCLSADLVLHILARDVETVGGNVVIMADGVHQHFSDTWRALAGTSRVEISLVIAHVIPDSGGDPIVDVVEINGQGCAISRTLLAGSDFLDLIAFADSIEV
jgi:hypothetical protein